MDNSDYEGEKYIKENLQYSINRLPVYIIGVASNKGDFNKTTEKAYIRLCEEGKNAMLGQWVGPKGNSYKEVSWIVSGITELQALMYKRQYNQISIIELDKNGNTRFI